MRSAKLYLTAVSDAEALASVRLSASFTATPPSSSATTISEATTLNDTIDGNSDGLAYPTVPPTSEQVVSADHLQFGFCQNQKYRYKLAHKPGTELKEAPQQDPPYYILLTTYLSYIFLISMGHIRDFFGKLLHPALYRHLLPFDVSHLFMRVNCRSRAPGLRLGVSPVTWSLICVLTGLRTSQLGF
jgi:serine palmitoyltransferase